jgi:hypothetical protein
MAMNPKKNKKVQESDANLGNHSIEEVIKGLEQGVFHLGDKTMAHYRADKAVVLAAVKTSWEALEFASDELKADREIILQAVSGSSDALEFAADVIKADPKIVLQAVSESGDALRFASEILKSNRELVTLAVKDSARNFRFAHESLRSDSEFVLILIRELGLPEIFQYASEAVKSDRNLVLEVLRLNPFLINHVDSTLCSNKDILMTAFGDYDSESQDDEEGLEQLVDLLKNNHGIETMAPGDIKEEVGKGMVNIHCLAAIPTDEPDTEILFYIICFQVQKVLIKFERVNNDEFIPGSFYTQRHYFKDEEESIELSDNEYFNEFIDDLMAPIDDDE